MTKNEIKFYVIRKWKKTWIFDSWEECKKNVNWISDAKYKSFKNIEEAKTALSEWWGKYYGKSSCKAKITVFAGESWTILPKAFLAHFNFSA